MSKQKPKTKKLILPLTLIAIFTITAGWFLYSKKISVELPEGEAASLALDDNGSNDLSSAPFNTSCGKGTLSGIEACGVPAIYKIKEGQGPSAYWAKGTINNLESAKNESESFQLIVRAPKNMSNVSLQMSDLAGLTNGAKIANSNIQLYKVEWVDINARVVDTKGDWVDSTAPVNPTNFQPDPLWPINRSANCSSADSFKNCFALKANKNLIFWLKINVPTGATAGQYSGTVNVSGLSTPFNYSLTVRNFVLPKKPMLGSMINYDGGTGATRKSDNSDIYVNSYYGTALPQDVNRLFYDEYIKARFSPFLYNIAFGQMGGDIKRYFTKDAGGNVNGITIDPSAFEPEAKTYFDNKKAFSTFNIMSYLWAITADKKPYLQFGDYYGTTLVRDDDNLQKIPADQRPKDNGSTLRIVSPTVFNNAVISYFKQVAAYLKTKGWMSRAVYYIEDEPSIARLKTMKEIALLIRQADPSIKTAAAIWDPTSLYDSGTKKYLLKDLVDASGNSLIDIWTPYYTHFPANKSTYMPTKNANFWNYDVNDNNLISNSGQTNRTVFWDIWKRNPGASGNNSNGYIYYVSTLWGPNPWLYPNFISPHGWKANAGDGYFFYPPINKDGSTPSGSKPIVPSIRWELMREGAEDFDYLKTLQNLITTAKAKGLSVVDANNALDAARSIGGSLGGYMIDELTFPGLNDYSSGADPKKDPIITYLRGKGWNMSSNKHCTEMSPSPGICNQWLAGYAGYGNPSPLGIKVTTGLPDGDYELFLNVYNTEASKTAGRQSRFRVRDLNNPSSTPVEYGTTNSNISARAENLSAGKVKMKGGSCSFEITPVMNSPYSGVAFYNLGFKKAEIPGGLYAARQQVANAIETLKSALKPPVDSDGAIIEN